MRLGMMTAAVTAVTMAMAAGTTTAGASDPPAQRSAAERQTFIVQLVDAPLASYTGGVRGLPPTNPRARGEKRLDPDSAASRSYLRHLRGAQRAVEERVRGALGRQPQVEHRYTHAYNGVAVEITAAEAERLRSVPGVRAVHPPVERELLTDAGPEWIGAPTVWDGSASGGVATQGEGVVIGIIDTGINTDHPSFAAVGGDGYVHENPRGTYYGVCAPLTGLPFCNDKLIGLWDFTGTGPEDQHGHGSHTAGTAGGNHVDATVSAPTIEVDRAVSGVAPHANIISYKGCGGPTAVCLSPNLVAAIDQATADGVDVINYSIGGGSNDPWSDADAQAFLGARDAGVFVATSAGNSGPGAATIGSPADAPWVLGVGAATHDRAFVNAVVGMSGGASPAPGDLTGNSFTAGYGPAPIVHAADRGDDGQCLNPFPPGTFDGEIVICERGTIPRVDKGSNVKAGGAGGLVLVNLEADGESTVADPHVLPAVHLGYTDGAVLTAWARDGGSGHTASIAGTTAHVDDDNGDVTAGFSSRGPNTSVPGVVKPDVTAPGVDILAPVHTVVPTEAAEFGLMSGTSMSSPHAAGAAALVRAVHPDWTPAEVQSAMMTTALDAVVRKDDGVTPADPFDRGAGRVDLTQATRAGLILDESTERYVAADPGAGGDPTSINVPSLGDAACAGTCTWTRTVRNPSDQAVTWTAAGARQGVDVTVSPRGFTLAAGEERTIKVTADVRGEEIGTWLFGSVRFSTSTPQVPDAHFPVAVAPAGAGGGTVEVESDAARGSHVETVTSPVDVKQLNVTVAGLRRGEPFREVLPQDPTPLDPYDTTVGTVTRPVEVPAASRLLAAEIVDTTSNDLDLFVGRDDNGDGVAQANEELCRSASETAFESCSLPSPDGGTYWVMVQNWLSGRAVDDVGGVVAVVPGSDEGNLTITGPGRVAAGNLFDLTLAWDVDSLEPGEVWYGHVELGSSRRSTADVASFGVVLRNPG